MDLSSTQASVHDLSIGLGVLLVVGGSILGEDIDPIGGLLVVHADIHSAVCALLGVLQVDIWHFLAGFAHLLLHCDVLVSLRLQFLDVVHLDVSDLAHFPEISSGFIKLLLSLLLLSSELGLLARFLFGSGLSQTEDTFGSFLFGLQIAAGEDGCVLLGKPDGVTSLSNISGSLLLLELDEIFQRLWTQVVTKL